MQRQVLYKAYIKRMLQAGVLIKYRSHTFNIKIQRFTAHFMIELICLYRIEKYCGKVLINAS